jgi:CRISPR-associated protein Cas6
MDARVADDTLVDVAFALQGEGRPSLTRLLLGDALRRWLPWLGETEGSGLHAPRLAPGGLVPRRARLLLRVPLSRLAEVQALTGERLEAAEGRLRLGDAQARALLAHPTLWSQTVVCDAVDELGLLALAEAWMQQNGLRGELVCGRRHELVGPDGPRGGHSLMLHGLSATDSLRAQSLGLGDWHWLGCGLFVPHKSAAAVGS